MVALGFREDVDGQLLLPLVRGGNESCASIVRPETCVVAEGSAPKEFLLLQ